MGKNGSLGALLAIDIDRDCDVPMHEQIAEAFRTAISSGRLHPGTRLPSTRALASDWNVSRNTVLHVFESLTSEGLLESRIGSGTFVGVMPALSRENHGQNGFEIEPSEGVDHANPQSAAHYPFRGLSRRGKALAAQSQLSSSERPVAFMPDIPDVRAFPMRSWLRLMNEVSGGLTGDILVDVSIRGYKPLREAIAVHLNLTRGIACSREDIIITTGTQQSIDLVSRLLLESGDPVWVEDPGYAGSRGALFANGCSLYPIPTDVQGMDVDQGLVGAPVPSMIVASPARHYPLGGRLSPERREKILTLADRCGTWVLEDDYDSDFDYAGAPPSALKAEDRSGRVVLIGTFSKTLLPSFRLGYIVAPKGFAESFARARSVMDRHAPILEQMVLAEFMHRGQYASHLRTMRSLYRERQSLLVNKLEHEFGFVPNSVELASGMHLVLPLRSGTDDLEAMARLKQAGVASRPLSPCHTVKARKAGLILGFAGFSAEEIERADLTAIRDYIA